MPQVSWNPKRERQYEHIKASVRRRGVSVDTADGIAALSVNKERARGGEAMERSTASLKDISSYRRGGLRSHKGPGGRTHERSTTRPQNTTSRVAPG
jgi:hypothetical protein